MVYSVRTREAVYYYPPWGTSCIYNDLTMALFCFRNNLGKPLDMRRER